MNSCIKESLLASCKTGKFTLYNDETEIYRVNDSLQNC